MHNIKKSSLLYHSNFLPGKISIKLPKQVNNQFNLSLAYTPGVAEVSKSIFIDFNDVYKYTSKGNLVAVISNGSAVLGLGNIGSYSSKPVMEGKSVLFKKFAGLDVFDIEVNSMDVEDLINIISKISDTFGAINIEDVKAPECFKLECSLVDKLNIPVLHDDQHGTAITVSAALLNALEIQDKKLKDIKLVCFGAGAAGIAILNLLYKLGLPKENIFLVDSKGVVDINRNDINVYKYQFASKKIGLNLYNVVEESDVLLGVSGGGLFTPKMLKFMNKKPIVFALSNPIPEIYPCVAQSVRKDLIIATGRSDFNNQVNNVLCFPYLFRGALDVRASKFNDSMFFAAIDSIRNLAKKSVPTYIKKAYSCENLDFSSNYILPKPIDDRLLYSVSSAVACAAIKSNVSFFY